MPSTRRASRAATVMRHYILGSYVKKCLRRAIGRVLEMTSQPSATHHLPRVSPCSWGNPDNEVHRIRSSRRDTQCGNHNGSVSGVPGLLHYRCNQASRSSDEVPTATPNHHPQDLPIQSLIPKFLLSFPMSPKLSR